MEGKYPDQKHAEEKQADVLILERPHTGERPLTEEVRDSCR